MASRSLRVCPSNTDDLAEWQVTLSTKCKDLLQEAFENRRILTHFVQQLPKPTGEQAIQEVTIACQIAYNIASGPAESKARELMQPGEPHFTGTRNTCILMWSFEDHSLWRGLSDNKKIVRLARSMIPSGYKRDELIRSRTFDLSSNDGILAAKLLFGDGQARGLSARLAWQFLIMHFRNAPNMIGEPMSMHIMESLLNIPSVFEVSGDSSHEDLMVAQAIRQNVKATYALPMNTLEWVGMILRTCGLKLGQAGVSGQAILECMQRCTTKYDSSVEVDAYDMQPVAKRPRRGRKKAAAAARTEEAEPAQDPDEDRLKIGTKRMNAIRNVITRSTEQSYNLLQIHLVWVGDYALSAVNDTILGLPWIWKGSLPDEDSHPDDVVLLARDVAAHANENLIAEGVTVKPMKYEELLTADQHEMILQKAFHNYEDEALHLADRQVWRRLIPTIEQWRTYRNVIQHWDLTIRECCQADLPAQDFDELQHAILYGDAMDSQIMSVIKRFPKYFNIGMIPDMKTNFAPNAVDEATREQIEAEQAKWQGELRLFKTNLSMDWKLIRRTEVGSTALHDILDWNDAQHVRQQGIIGKSLVSQFMASYFPKAVASSWADIPGAVCMSMQAVHKAEGPPKHPPRILAIIDFNVPNSRDALRLPQIAQAVAMIFRNVGPTQCALLAHMAAYSKEDSETDPLDDELTIKQIFLKAGFGSQQRLRMLLGQPPSIESFLRAGDWHADSRLMYLTPNDLAARGDVKDVPGNCWRMKSELARTTQITVRPLVPTPQEMVYLTSTDKEEQTSVDKRMNKEDKAAQRGPCVAAAYLKAALTKASVTSTDVVHDEAWVQPGEETWIVDLTPWVGDRAMASLGLMGTSSSKYGDLRHIFIDPSYKRMGQAVSFSHARVSNEVAAQWINWSRVLYDTVEDERGERAKVPKHPLDSVPPPEESVLKEVPGAYEAWKGLSSLDLKVCIVRGPKIIIHPEKLAAFQHAPLSVSEEVRSIEREHSKYEDVLAFLATAITPNPSEEDPRVEQKHEPESASTEYAKFESIDALQAHAPNLVEHVAMGDKSITMLRDDSRHEVWFLSKNDHHIIPKYTIMGAYGSGSLLPRNTSNSDVVPFSLPQGDKDMVQILAGAEEDTKSKPASGTLYSLAKPLEKKAAQKGTSLTITAYGKLIPEGAAGKHQYTFEFPDGNPKHKGMDYCLASKGGTKTSSGNFFAPLANREGWEGPLGDMWRLAYDSVRHNLTARKPHVATKDNISLKKGEPIKVLWRKAGASAATASADAEASTAPAAAASAARPIQAA